MRIRVTPEDIRNGARINAERCPVALAMARTIGWRVNVSTTDFSISGSPTRYALPWTARSFISRYDSKVQVDPVVFDLELQKEER